MSINKLRHHAQTHAHNDTITRTRRLVLCLQFC